MLSYSDFAKLLIEAFDRRGVVVEKIQFDNAVLLRVSCEELKATVRVSMVIYDRKNLTVVVDHAKMLSYKYLRTPDCDVIANDVLVYLDAYYQKRAKALRVEADRVERLFAPFFQRAVAGEPDAIDQH